ncbi:hypothetical protein CPB84DRAFT_1156727 [Gymnopilus junonius]|uniref:Uncharacterized protein n=1 Tax=Gymnopilus junonius TaxID=109634 RepID=A0A9P5TMG0_GYMJU|nr:hypothetical protein CPB84DRAFT_1156727 [Gymnopilus junonius]
MKYHLLGPRHGCLHRGAESEIYIKACKSTLVLPSAWCISPQLHAYQIIQGPDPLPLFRPQLKKFNLHSFNKHAFQDHSRYRGCSRLRRCCYGPARGIKTLTPMTWLNVISSIWKSLTLVMSLLLPPMPLRLSMLLLLPPQRLLLPPRLPLTATLPQLLLMPRLLRLLPQ